MERILSAVVSLPLQGRDVFTSLVHAREADVCAAAPPFALSNYVNTQATSAKEAIVVRMSPPQMSRSVTPVPRLTLPGASLVVGAFVSLLVALLAVRPVRSVSAPPVLQIGMGHHVVEWEAAPGEAFAVRVTSDDEKAFTNAYADAEGRVRVKLHQRTNAFAYALVEPDDHFEILADEGSRLLEFVVPDFRVDVGDEGRRVAGHAPAGARVTVTIESGTGAAPYERAVDADADGRFSTDLPEPLRLAEGAGGRAVVVGSEGQQYTAVFARRRVEVVVDSARIQTRASQQSPIEAERVVTQSGRTRVRGFSRDYPRQEGISPDGRRTLVDDYPYVLRAGDTVTITQRGGGMDRDDRWPRIVPDLRVRLDADRIRGWARAGEAVEVILLDADGGDPRLAETVRADATGRFDFELPDGLEPAAGWRATARVDTGDGIWMRAEAIIPRLEAAVNAAHVGIEALPFLPVTLTLRSPDGATLAGGTFRTDHDGRLDAQLVTGEEERRSGWDIMAEMRPGDILEVELVDGDPKHLVVPLLTGRTDPDAERIHGRADPDREIGVELVKDDERRRFAVTAGPDGRWQLDLTGEEDLEPDRHARIEVMIDGHSFYRYTAPISLKLITGRSYAEASPFIGYSTAITLTTPAGRVAATGSRIATALEPPIVFDDILFFLDRFDRGVAIRPGDRLTWRTGFDSASLEMPLLEARAHVLDDLVVGRTVAGGRLRIETAPLDPRTRVYELEADGSGRFLHRFDDFDLRYNSNISVVLERGRHRIVHHLELPGLVLDLSSGQLLGHLEPSVRVLARVGEDGRPSASGTGWTDSEAEFEIDLSMAEGRVPMWSPGQELTLEAPGAELTERIDWHVPPLEIEPDGKWSVSGLAEPGSELQVRRHMSPLNFGASSRTQRPRPDADGHWSASFNRPALAPGAITMVDAVLPGGHIVKRRHVEPMVVVRYGTDQVCGVGMPDAVVHVSSRDVDGRLLAHAVGRVSRAGTFDLRLEPEGADAEALVREGQRVEAVVGEKEIGFEIGPMDLDLDVPGGRIHGSVLPNAPLILRSPIRTCLRGDAHDDQAFGRGDGRNITYNTRARADGELNRELEMSTIDYGVDVTVFTPEGHAYIGSIFPHPSITAWVDENRVTGLAPPSAEVEARLLDADDLVRGEGRARAGADAGRYEALLFDATDAPVRIRIGDRVEVWSAGARSEMEVERLGFDLDPTESLIVNAPSDRRLELRFVHPSGEEHLAVRSDDEGRYAFDTDDLPPRAGWALADVRELDVVLPQSLGKATASGYRAPDTGARSLWLPALSR